MGGRVVDPYHTLIVLGGVKGRGRRFSCTFPGQVARLGGVPQEVVFPSTE